MLFELFFRKQFMLMGEDFLVPRAQIAHDLMMNGLDVTMQVWPTQTSYIATCIRTIVPEQKYSVFKDFGFLVTDAEVIVFL